MSISLILSIIIAKELIEYLLSETINMFSEICKNIFQDALMGHRFMYIARSL